MAPIIKDGSQWKRTPIHYQLDHEKIQRLTQQREVEWAEIQDYVQTQKCLMEFLRHALNDPKAEPCGQCANCLGQPVINIQVEHSLIVQAQQYLCHAEMPLEPRKQMPTGLTLKKSGLTGKLKELQAHEGRILSRWGDAGWGHIVAEDKRNNDFRDELVTALFEMITQRWQPQPSPQWVTYVPSLRHPQLVANLAYRVAQRLKLPLFSVVTKRQNNPPQKSQNNSFHQCKNLDGIFVIEQPIPNTPVLLIDDIVDSGWTLTMVAALLRQAKSGPVFPVALATTKGHD